MIKKVFPFFKYTSPLSNFHNAKFTTNGITYLHVEQFMMAQKARLFGDKDTLDKILKTWSPMGCKKLGRQVKNYDEATWQAWDVYYVRQGVMAKMLQNPSIKAFLLNIEEEIIAEASPYDKKWGIGINEDHPNIQAPDKWKGSNLLGKIWMDVRKELSNK